MFSNVGFLWRIIHISLMTYGRGLPVPNASGDSGGPEGGGNLDSLGMAEPLMAPVYVVTP